MEVGRGDFDAVFLAFEANKLLRGCKSGYKMVEASATDSIRRQIAGRAKTSQVKNHPTNARPTTTRNDQLGIADVNNSWKGYRRHSNLLVWNPYLSK
eukprot:478725-Amphidinium_carterae.1